MVPSNPMGVTSQRTPGRMGANTAAGLGLTWGGAGGLRHRMMKESETLPHQG